MLQKNQEYLPVNWIDGMNINKDHFINQDNYLIEQINSVSGININGFNYGIISCNASEKELFNIWFDADKGDQVLIKIENLKAVTPGGSRIEISSEASEPVRFNIDYKSITKDLSKDDTFLVILSINPFVRVPHGEADPNENPPRKPFSLPEYNIHLIPESKAGDGNIGLYHLVVGRAFLKSGEFEFQDNYIPPCQNIQSNQKLREMHAAFEKQLSGLEKSCIKIAQKVRKKQQRNTLALAISSISNHILSFLSTEMTQFRYIIKEMPPVFTFEKIASLARIIKNGIDTWQGIGKEEMLTYLTEWCDLNQGLLESTLNNLINLDYNHNDIRKSVEKADSFLSVIVPLFDTLAGLDYIGKKTDTNLFVKEEMSFGEIQEETKRGK